MIWVVEFGYFLRFRTLFDHPYLTMSDYPIHIEIQNRVHLIRGTNRSRFPEANCLLVDDEILTLVDAGANRDHIIRTLTDLGHRPEDIDRIILTHFHVDHKGHAMYFHELSDCEMLCHPLAEKGIMTFEGFLEFYGIKGHKNYEDWMRLIHKRLPFVLFDYVVTGHFENMRPIDCGNTTLIPIYSPGHTHDHTCFAINDTSTIFLVDIDLTRFGPWYGNLVSDISQFKESIDRIIAYNPRCGISSHLLHPTTDGLISRLEQYRAIIDERDARILKNIRAGYDTVEKLTMHPTIYPRIPLSAYLIFEEIMVKKHIELLKQRDILIEEDGHLKIERA